jgi:hypothetical protein
MLGSFKNSPEHLQALDRVKEWTRERFKLSQESAILVSEIACTLPGCPPLETVVAFWTADETRHHFKLFKPVEEVVSDDLPFAWLMNSLAAPEGYDDGCC